MARIKIKDGGDQDVVLAYLAPIVGIQAVTGATVTGYGTTTVALTTIATSDVVMCQLLSNSSVGGIITNIAITANTGFDVTTQGPTAATLVYAVFHQNS